MIPSGVFRFLGCGMLVGALLTGWPWSQAWAAPGKMQLAQAGRESGAVQEKGLPAGQEETEGAKPSAESQEFECPATFGPLVTDTAVPIEKGKFALQPTFSLSFITASLDKNWRWRSARGDFRTFAMDWKLTYGLWDNLEVFVVLPYVHNWACRVDEPGPHGERYADNGNIGDINLTLKYRLLSETATRPTVTFLFATDFPTGRFRGLKPHLLGTDQTGGGAFVFTTGFNLSKYLRPFVFYANVWYSQGTSFKDDEGWKHPRDFVTVNLAAEYPITKKWVALLEFVSTWDSGRLFGSRPNVPPASLVSLVPGLEFMATEKFSLALGVQIDVAGRNTQAAVTPILSLVYAF